MFEHLTWLRALESTLPFKTASHNSWETAQLSKMLCDNAPLTVRQFDHNIVSPKFPATLSCLNLLEAPSLSGEYFIFFLWFQKHRALDYFSQFKCCVKRASNYFCYFNGITVNLLKSVTMAICQMDSISFMHAAIPALAPTMLECSIKP